MVLDKNNEFDEDSNGRISENWLNLKKIKNLAKFQNIRFLTKFKIVLLSTKNRLKIRLNSKLRNFNTILTSI